MCLLNVKSMEDWYAVDSRDFNDNGGSALLHYHYKASPSVAVMTIFDTHEWIPWKFQYFPTTHWNDKALQLNFLQYPFAVFNSIGLTLGMHAREKLGFEKYLL